MASFTQWKTSSRQYRDRRSPNTVSPPIPMPNDRIYKDLPLILRNDDTTPGTIHHGRAFITDYTSWHFPSKIAIDEQRITSRRAPPCWVEKVGIAPQPGLELRKVARKEVSIVPELCSPQDNKREMNRLKWEGRRGGRIEEGKKKKEKKKKEEPGEDSGYESAGEPKGVWVDVNEMEDQDFSVWSC